MVVEREEERACSILHVEEGAPEMPLIQHDDLLVDRLVDEVVDQQVEPHSGSDAEHGREAQRHRALVAAHPLAFGFRAAVARERIDVRLFGADAVDGAVGRPGRGKHEGAPSGDLYHVPRSRQVRGFGQRGFGGASRHAHDRGKVYECIATFRRTVQRVDVAHVGAHERHLLGTGEIENGMNAKVELVVHDDIMPLFYEHRHQYGTQVARAPRDHNFHRSIPPTRPKCSERFVKTPPVTRLPHMSTEHCNHIRNQCGETITLSFYALSAAAWEKGTDGLGEVSEIYNVR